MLNKQMHWKNVKLVLLREIRDQLRDRRTIFMIAVLPVFFYPLLGLALFQVTHFLQKSNSKVLIVGHQSVSGGPNLIEDGRFSSEFLSDDAKELVDLLELEFRAASHDHEAAGLPTAEEKAWQQAVASGEVQAVVYFPPDFAERMEEYRAAVKQRFERPREATDPLPELPHPLFVYDSGKEKSALAYNRVARVLSSWAHAVGRQNLRESQIPEAVASPKAYDSRDLAAESGGGDARLWAKILPFILVIWAVTGAFYPAVDLCAGEKERGTLETLLSSPAARSDIVIGKLLTVMAFSMTTAILNLVSMGFTGLLVLHQLQQMPGFNGPAGMGMPSLSAVFWLLVVLVPVSALFSAICLALAAFARSTKEGQYYLMPVILITMPLIVLPMSPAVELTLGTSLVPVTGIVLMLRGLIEGTFWQEWPLAIPVIVSTFVYCYLAVRWAVDQFNSEKVLFRAADRFSLGAWMRHLFRDRQATPSVQMAILCGTLILLLRFFMGLAMPGITGDFGFADFAKIAVISQLVVILTPALLMTVMLTRSPRKTLLLDLPHWGAVPAAILLALMAHPWVIALQQLVTTLYPMQKLEGLERMFDGAPNIWWILLVIAVLPALCEEIAFRGFILSGLRHLGHRWRAITISALFFGVSHGILQQSIIATFVGCLIGYLAVQTGSVWTGVAYHMVHNSLAVLASKLKEPESWPQWLRDRIDGEQLLEILVWQIGPDTEIYSPWIMLPTALVGAGLLFYFHQLPHYKSDEEALQESIDAESGKVLVS